MSLMPVGLEVVPGITLKYCANIDPYAFISHHENPEVPGTKDVEGLFPGSAETFTRTEASFGKDATALILKKLHSETLIDIGCGQQLNYPLIDLARRSGLKRLIGIDYCDVRFDPSQAQEAIGSLEVVLLKGNFFDFLPTLKPHYHFTAGQIDHFIVPYEDTFCNNCIKLQDLIDYATKPGGIYFGQRSWHYDLTQRPSWAKHDVDEKSLYFLLEKKAKG